jgi:hypothetical protein
MTQAAILAASASPGTSTGFKNHLINGDMQIWQRGTTFTGTSSILYYADRWSAIQFAGSTSTISQVSGAGLSGSQFVMRCQRPNGATNTATINMGQSIESQNCFDLAGKSVTLSFSARAGAGFSAAGGILVSQIVYGTGTDQNVYGTYTGAVSASQNNTLTSSFQRFTQTTFIPSNATEVAIVLFYTPVGTAGASDFYEFGQAQLEVGTTATNFENRSIGTELALCQRYFWRSPSNNNSAGLGFALGTGGSTFQRAQIPLPVQMRAVPTTVFSGINLFNSPSSIISATITNSYSTVNTISVDGNTSATASPSGGSLLVYLDSGSSFVSASAEL